MNEEEKRAIEEYQRHTLECINYLVKTAESVGIEGVNQDVPISVETCVEIMRRLDAKIPRWILVSERLPEEREWYLAVFKESDTGYQLIPRVADYIGNGENKWRIIDEDGIASEYFDLLECIAWMSLPEWHGGEK